MAEHRHDAALQRIDRRRLRQQLLDRLTAAPLGPCRDGAEHGAAGVGVDLDEAEAAAVQVEVVAEEHTAGALRVAGDWGCARQHHLTIGRQCHHGLDRTDHRRHPIHVRAIDEHRPRGEQMRAPIAHQRIEIGGGERLREAPVVQAGAETLLVQAVHHGRRFTRSCPR